MKSFSIRLYDELSNVLDTYRETVNRSKNEVVVRALEEYFQQKGLLETTEEKINNIKINGNKQKEKTQN